MTNTDVRTAAEDPGPGAYAAARLSLLQRGARPGPPRRKALAALTDDWLNGLFTAAAGSPRGLALVAVGGYGRGELSPRSDLDLLLLHDGGTPAAAIARVADRIWYPVWDLGLDLDHSVRTLAETRRTADDDLRAQLGLLDARHLAGDRGTTAALRTTVLADWRNQAPARLPRLRELCEERAARAGELPYLLEPDLKEARGGLRDATALRAVAASWLADAPREGLDDARRRPTSATPSTSPPDAPPTASPCRNRTRWPPPSASSTPTPSCARSTRPPAPSPTPPTSPGARSAASCDPARYGPGRAPCSPAGAPSTVPRSPRASSNRTGRPASPAPRAPNATPCSRCAPPPRQPRPGCRSRRTRCAASPPPPRRCPRPGPPRHATSSSSCSAPAGPPYRSGRRWRPRDWSAGCCPTGNASAAVRSATPSTPGPSTGTWWRPPSTPPP